MATEFAVYDTVYLRFVGGISEDQQALAEIADELTTSTGRLHEVRNVQTAPGVTETASFTGTLVGATDNQSAQVLLAVKPGTEVKDWAPVVDGAVKLDSSTAGDCRVNVVVQTVLDYSGTTAPDNPGDSAAYYSVSLDGDSVVDLDGGTIVGTGDDEVTIPAVRGSGAATDGVVTFEAAAVAHDAEAVAIDDGVATHTVALNITRIAPAPEL